MAAQSEAAGTRHPDGFRLTLRRRATPLTALFPISAASTTHNRRPEDETELLRLLRAERRRKIPERPPARGNLRKLSR